MGKLVIPKHTADLTDFKEALRILYDAGDWIENDVFVQKIKEVIGDTQYPSSYNKKAQIPKYFGFVTVDKPGMAATKLKITTLGQMLFEAIDSNNQALIEQAFMIAFENTRFGRHNAGSPSSDSDVEAPNVALRAMQDLEFITNQELAYILTELNNDENYDSCLSEIKESRKEGRFHLRFENNYTDNKPLIIMKHFNLITTSKKKVYGKLVSVNSLSSEFSRKYSVNIKNLPIVIKEIETLKNTEDKGDLRAKNILFYGVPGSGKSQKINDKYGKDESKITRVVFHPDYMNTDFIGQILPTVDSNGNITYSFTPGPFSKVMKKAYQDPENMYYLVIEEINRGNAPAIFGDIFQLLDRDDNGESKYCVANSMVANEMYGDPERQIKIPSNLTILATMNTSDQNVFTLDTAFQRRWSMEMIENKVSEAEHALEKIADSNVTWKAFNEIINERILNSNSTMMSSEDKRLGAYFVTKNDLRDHDAGEFAEKVIKYLWDDAFKFFRDKLFKPSYKSLEEVIIDFSKNKTGNDRFEIFIDEIKDNLIKTTQSSGINDGRVLEEEDRTSDEEDTTEVNLQDGDSEEVVHE